MSVTSPSPTDDSKLQHQFRRPSGIAGRAVGWIMWLQNWTLNQSALSCLKVGAQDDVLEIGCGPGQAVKLLAATTLAQSIAGVDPSGVMLEQAASANEPAIRAGRVVLMQAQVEQLPFGNDHFSRAFAVSTFHDWDDRAQGLAELHRVLRPGGRLVLCLRRAPHITLPWSSPGLTREELQEDQALLKQQGFHHVHIATHRWWHRVVCLVGQR